MEKHMSLTDKILVVALLGALHLGTDSPTAGAAVLGPTGEVVNNVCLAPSGAWWAYPPANAQRVGSSCTTLNSGELGTVVAGWIQNGIWVSNLCRAGAAWWLYPPAWAQPIGTTCTVGGGGPVGVVSQI
jgi:hypothetical protein